MLGCGGADWYKRWFGGARYALVAGAGDDTAGGKESFVPPIVMISSAVLNKEEEEERLESGCWVDNWWLISRFIHVVGNATSFSSNYWVDTCWWLVDWCWMFCGLFG
eukprot:scaffold90114_cov31-Attheya_sp.AAC.3